MAKAFSALPSAPASVSIAVWYDKDKPESVLLENVIVTDESCPNVVPSLAATCELLELYVHSCAPEIETSARAAFVKE